MQLLADKKLVLLTVQDVNVIGVCAALSPKLYTSHQNNLDGHIALPSGSPHGCEVKPKPKCQKQLIERPLEAWLQNR